MYKGGIQCEISVTCTHENPEILYNGIKSVLFFFLLRIFEFIHEALNKILKVELINLSYNSQAIIS